MYTTADPRAIHITSESVEVFKRDSPALTQIFNFSSLKGKRVVRVVLSDPVERDLRWLSGNSMEYGGVWSRAMCHRHHLRGALPLAYLRS